MNRKRIIVMVIISVLIIGLVITTILGSTFKIEEARRVTVILKSEQRSEFWGEIISGIERAGDDYNIEYKFVSSMDENDVNGQMALINEVISEAPDGIILAATDYYKLDDATKYIRDAGIHLILIDSGVLGNAYDSIVATDNYQAGYNGAERLSSYLENPKHIVLVNHVQSSLTAMERERGARDALKEAFDDVTVEIFYCNDDPDAAYSYIDRLHRYGVEIDGIIGLNERSTIGAARFMNEHSEDLDFPIVGFDSSVEEIQLLEKEIVKTLVIQQPFNMGYTAMASMVDVLDGKKIEKNIDTGSRIITKENMYDPENQVILFPFNK